MYHKAVRPTVLASLAFAGLTSACIGALWADRSASEETAVAKAAARLDIVAALAAHESNLIVGRGSPTSEDLEKLARALPTLSLSDGRVLYLADAQGFVVASTDARQHRTPRTLAEIFGDVDGTSLAHADGVFEAVLRDGIPAIATVRPLAAGHLAMVQARGDIASESAPHSGFAHPALALLLVTGIAGFGTSLRYRRRALRAGRTCTRLTRQLDTSLESGQCGLWDWDATRGRVHWSASMYRMLGYEPRGEFLSTGEAAAILMAEEGCIRRAMDVWATSDTPQVHQDVRARHASGRWVWLRVKGQSLRDPVDGSRHVVGFAVDVTRDRQDAERRAEDEIRLRDAVEAISEAFVLWDAEGRLVLCNSKFLHLHDIPEDFAKPGTPSSEILAASRPPLTEKQVSAGTPFDPDRRTLERQLPDGRWLQVSERRTKDGGVVSVGTDVSELKWKEEKLRARELRLKGSVRAAETQAQRYAAIAERNYEANLAKTEFLARMSHELRTPLNAIIGFSDLMRQEIMGPLGCGRYTEYTRDIHASGLKLLDTIDGILQMSRIEKGQLRLVPEVMRIETALAEALELVGPEVESQHCAVDLDIVPPATLQADTSALREILAQVLRNAVRYSTADANIRVRVRPARNAINIFVEDDGIGIPADVLPRLGRPFEQVEAEYSRAGGGSGLGLAIARGLVELHGGRLKIRSQLGVGTIVLIHLPTVQPAANDTGLEPHASLLRPRLIAAE